MRKLSGFGTGIARVVAVAAACLVAGAPAMAQDGALRTLATGDAGRGWEAVGRINLGRAGFCTGALIAPDLVLTAAHCLYHPETGAPVPVAEIEFLAGWRNGRAEAYRGVRRAAQHPDYAFEGRDRIDRVAFDLALLQLDQPIRNPSIRPFATAERAGPGAEVGVVSYAKGRESAPALEELCHVLAREETVMMLSCSVDFGASGAPIFVVEGGEARIVSVVSAKAEAQAQRVALGTDVGQTLAAVRGQLDGSDGVFRRLVPPQDAARPASGGGAKFLRP